MTDHKEVRPHSSITRLVKESHRTRTMWLITRYLRDETGCDGCASGVFCVKPNFRWHFSCLPYQQIADHLNAEGHKTRFGKEWTATQVKREFERRKGESEDVDVESFVPPTIRWEQLDIDYGLAEAYTDSFNEHFTTIKPTSIDSTENIDHFLAELRTFLLGSLHPTNDLTVGVLQLQKED